MSSFQFGIAGGHASPTCARRCGPWVSRAAARIRRRTAARRTPSASPPRGRVEFELAGASSRYQVSTTAIGSERGRRDHAVAAHHDSAARAAQRAANAAVRRVGAQQLRIVPQRRAGIKIRAEAVSRLAASAAPCPMSSRFAAWTARAPRGHPREADRSAGECRTSPSTPARQRTGQRYDAPGVTRPRPGPSAPPGKPGNDCRVEALAAVAVGVDQPMARERPRRAAHPASDVGRRCQPWPTRALSSGTRECRAAAPHAERRRHQRKLARLVDALLLRP